MTPELLAAAWREDANLVAPLVFASVAGLGIVFIRFTSSDWNFAANLIGPGKFASLVLMPAFLGFGWAFIMLESVLLGLAMLAVGIWMGQLTRLWREQQEEGNDEQHP